MAEAEPAAATQQLLVYVRVEKNPVPITYKWASAGAFHLQKDLPMYNCNIFYVNAKGIKGLQLTSR